MDNLAMYGFAATERRPGLVDRQSTPHDATGCERGFRKRVAAAAAWALVAAAAGLLVFPSARYRAVALTYPDDHGRRSLLAVEEYADPVFVDCLISSIERDPGPFGAEYGFHMLARDIRLELAPELAVVTPERVTEGVVGDGVFFFASRPGRNLVPVADLRC